MRKPKLRKSLAEWAKQEQAKHPKCHCGCGKEIIVTRGMGSNGIPKFILGHAGRKKKPKYGYLNREEKLEWVAEHQGKHICQCGCGAVIEISIHHLNNGLPKYKHGHETRLRKYPPDTERFWGLVTKGEEDDCWEWAGARHRQGYGHFRTTNVMAKGFAHRFSYFLHKGAFDPDLHVLHECDNPPCVNPKHLFLGNHQDNMQDAAKKGKFSRFAPETILRVVELRRKGLKGSEVSKITGVCQSVVCWIMKGRVWSHLTGIEPESLHG